MWTVPEEVQELSPIIAIGIIIIYFIIALLLMIRDRKRHGKW